MKCKRIIAVLIFSLLIIHGTGQTNTEVKDTCLFASFKTNKLVQMVWTAFFGDKKAVCALANPNLDDLIFIKEMIEEGRYITTVDKSFTLKQSDEAHRYIESKMHKGNIVIKL